MSDRLDVLARMFTGAMHRHRWTTTAGGAMTDSVTGEPFWVVVARYAQALGADPGDGTAELHGPVPNLGEAPGSRQR